VFIFGVDGAASFADIVVGFQFEIKVFDGVEVIVVPLIL
jgi:hypothetical protein